MMGWCANNNGIGAGTWLLMGLVWAVLIGAILWAVVRLLPSNGTRTASPRADSPEEILDRRFASGEIDAATYRANREALTTVRGPRR